MVLVKVPITKGTVWRKMRAVSLMSMLVLVVVVVVVRVKVVVVVVACTSSWVDVKTVVV